MMKLKYLFSNEDLAEMILKNWKHDKDDIDMFKYYRISANAIYPFKVKGEIQFLRFAPKSEKKNINILAELDFIHYLKSKQYGVLEPVKSKDNKELIEVETPWGKYLATVFKRVKGEQINKTDFNDDIIFTYGKALGKLHQLSSGYLPNIDQRWSCEEVLQWISDILMNYPEEKLALQEAKKIQNFYSTLPMTKDNFGLVHYDFECDNVFFDKASKTCNVIDFDDAMYHWYVMDITQALESLKEYIPNDKYQDKKQCFIDGYNTEYNISDDMMSIMPIFRRFANLYGYTRVLRSIDDKWDNEPQWMEKLRIDLSQTNESDSSFFGDEI